MSIKSIQTPRGVLNHTYISGQGVNLKPEGQPVQMGFKSTLILERTPALEFINQIYAYFQEMNVAKPNQLASSLGYRPCMPDGNEKDANGNPLDQATCTHFAFRFKTNAVMKTGEPADPVALYDSGDPATGVQPVQLPNTTIVGTGSEGIIAGGLFFYDNIGGVGVSLVLDAIQVIKFKTRNPGFLAQEGGEPHPNQGQFASQPQTAQTQAGQPPAQGGQPAQTGAVPPGQTGTPVSPAMGGQPPAQGGQPAQTQAGQPPAQGGQPAQTQAGQPPAQTGAVPPTQAGQPPAQAGGQVPPAQAGQPTQQGQANFGTNPSGV